MIWFDHVWSKRYGPVSICELLWNLAAQGASAFVVFGSLLGTQFSTYIIYIII